MDEVTCRVLRGAFVGTGTSHGASDVAVDEFDRRTRPLISLVLFSNADGGCFCLVLPEFVHFVSFNRDADV